MEIEFYLPFQLVGLIRDISEEYHDGWQYWHVSAKCPDVFGAMVLGMIPALLILALIVRYIAQSYVTRHGENATGKKLLFAVRLLRIYSIIQLVYAVLMGIGIGPYLVWYPGHRGDGFLDLSVIEHIIDAVVHGLYALALYLGGRAGYALAKRRERKM